MKIAIPTEDKKGLDDRVAEHFGRCKTFTFLDEDGRVIEIIDNASSHTFGSKLPPELLKEKGANIVLCKALGIKALNLCKKLGIEVYTGQAETVREMFNLWKNGKLDKNFKNVCSGEHGNYW